ncbi:MAG: hypothetical protein WA082_03345 [Candidatus Moraniibacteriota bacterium]
MSLDVLATMLVVLVVAVAVVRDQSVRQAWKQTWQEFRYARRLF